MLHKYAHPPSPPLAYTSHPTDATSTPIAINRMSAQGMITSSPMEEEDTFTMDTVTMSRSWDDIEGARSILNLNSPASFHPTAERNVQPVSSFSLTSAASSAPSHFYGTGFTRNHGSFGLQQQPPPPSSHQSAACMGIKALADAVGVASRPAAPAHGAMAQGAMAQGPLPSFQQTGRLPVPVPMASCSGAVATQ